MKIRHWAALALIPIQAWASDLDQPRYVGVLFGNAFGLNEDTKDSLTYGARFGIKIFQSSAMTGSLGLVAGTLSQSETDSGFTVTQTVTAVLLEAIGRQCWGTGFYLGARLGLGTLSLDLDTGTGVRVGGSDTNFLYGPVVGYEIPLNANTSLSLDANWLSMGEGSINILNLITVQHAALSSLLVQVGVQKHW
jgi:hypothetical protein